MKRVCILGCCIVSAADVLIAQAVYDPFTQTQTPPLKEEIPNRGIKSLPGSIIHRTLEDGRHEYRINGLYPREGDRKVETFESYFREYVEAVLVEGTEVRVSSADTSITVTTTSAIPYDTFAYVVDTVASGIGVMPFWVELESRDLQESPDYNPHWFRFEEWKGEFPVGLACLGMESNRELRFSFGFPGLLSPGNATLLIGPTTAQCMCHSRFTVRVLDAEDRLIWKSEDPAQGSLEVAIVDLNKDGCHEVFFKADDHGKLTRYMLKSLVGEDLVEKPNDSPDSVIP